MTIFHSEPYKEITRVDHTTFPLIGFVESNRDKPYGYGASNDKPHEVYCEHCEYRTEIQGIMNPKCGRCDRNLITIVQSRLPDGIVNFGETKSQD